MGNWYGIPLLLFAIPDQAARMNHFEVALPKMAKLDPYHRSDRRDQGLNDFAGNHPPVAPVFLPFA